MANITTRTNASILGGLTAQIVAGVARDMHIANHSLRAFAASLYGAANLLMAKQPAPAYSLKRVVVPVMPGRVERSYISCRSTTSGRPTWHFTGRERNRLS